MLFVGSYFSSRDVNQTTSTPTFRWNPNVAAGEKVLTWRCLLMMNQRINASVLLLWWSYGVLSSSGTNFWTQSKMTEPPSSFISGKLSRFLAVSLSRCLSVGVTEERPMRWTEPMSGLTRTIFTSGRQNQVQPVARASPPNRCSPPGETLANEPGEEAEAGPSLLWIVAGRLLKKLDEESPSSSRTIQITRIHLSNKISVSLDVAFVDVHMRTRCVHTVTTFDKIVFGSNKPMMDCD